MDLLVLLKLFLFLGIINYLVLFGAGLKWLLVKQITNKGKKRERENEENEQ